jgi:hypothetical protein
MLEKVLGVCALRHWFYLAAKLPHMEVGVDGLACLLHRPMACNHQMRGQGLQLDAILSFCYSGWWQLTGDVKPLGHRYLMECLPSGYPVLEAVERGCWELRRVPSWVMRLGHNRHPSVPQVQYLDSSPQAFC